MEDAAEQHQLTFAHLPSELKGTVSSHKKRKYLRREKQYINHKTSAPELPPLQEIVKKRPSVIVELDPPKKLDTTKFLQGAKALKEVGIDAITLADNSLAHPNFQLARDLVKNKRIRPLIHITCRDRNLIGLQSHLMGFIH